MTQTYDVVVVGAGPGGAAAAHDLAQAGLNVLLLDKADFPRDKTCGDGLTPRAVHHLTELGVLPKLAADAPRISQALLVAPNGTPLTVPLPDQADWPSYIQIVPRLVLDDALRQRVVAAGARFIGSTRAQRIEQRADHVVVHGDQRGAAVSFRSRIVILATGANANLLLQTGLIHAPPHVALAARAYFDDVDQLDPTTIQMRFSGVPLPGYGWIFPTSATSANIGLGVFPLNAPWRRRPTQPSARAHFDAFVEHPALQAMLHKAQRRGPIKGYPIRTDFLTSRAYGPRIVAVGEAAGLVNPLTGDGIDFALESGRMAAAHLRSFFAADDLSTAALAAYDQQLRVRFGRLFRRCAQIGAWGMTSPQMLNLMVLIARAYPRLPAWLAADVLGNGTRLA